MPSFDDFPQGNSVIPQASSYASEKGFQSTEAHPAAQERQPGSMVRQSSYRLPAVQSSDLTQALAGTFRDTTSLRTPIVIKGKTKKAVSASRHKSIKRRLVFTLLGTFLLLMVTSGTLFAVSPLGRDTGLGNLLHNQASSSLVQSQKINPNLVMQATATAVVNKKLDGYDPYASNGVTVSNGSGSLNWPVGQCTFWANYRYHQLTGFWVSWAGNADQWVTGAQMAKWNVSTSPHVPSIIVLMPGTQGASSVYGHVAVVEQLINSTTVKTSTMNWFADGGGFDIESYFNFTVGTGVYFVWHS